MMKRLLSMLCCFVLIFCLLFAALPAVAFAEADEPLAQAELAQRGGDDELAESGALLYGTSGNCSWRFDNVSGELAVYGTGEMADYDWDWENDIYPTPWNAFRLAIRSVKVEGTVKKIGMGAFYRCQNLTSVEIKSGVEVIETDAFSKTSISSVTIPDSVVRIGGSFYDCIKLKTVSLGSHVEEIGMSAFSNTLLESITFPDSLETLGGYAFSDCVALSSASGGKNLFFIGEYAFENTKVKTFVVYQSYAIIQDNAFGYVFAGYDGSGEPISQKVYGCTLRGYRGGTAQQYCLDNPHITFSPLDTEGSTTGEVQVISFLSDKDPVQIQLLKYGTNNVLGSSFVTGNDIINRYKNLQYNVYTVRLSKKNHTPYEGVWNMCRAHTDFCVTLCPIGDVNLSGKVDIKDVNRLYKHVMEIEELWDPYELACGNVNNDSTVDIKDVNALYKHVMETKLLY